jgi:c-di-GMP-binding flagellar brake protein YcgR
MLYDAEGELMYKGKVRDISQGGVLVLSGGLDDLLLFEESQEVNFKLNLPTGLVAGTAEVTYVDSDEGRMGLKFTKIVNKDGISNLMAFVANGFAGA